jgi:hypothetical protein
MENPDFYPKDKGGIRYNGDTGWKKIFLQKVWCRVYRNPRRQRDTLLLRQTNGTEEVAV